MNFIPLLMNSNEKKYVELIIENEVTYEVLWKAFGHSRHAVCGNICNRWINDLEKLFNNIVNDTENIDYNIATLPDNKKTFCVASIMEYPYIDNDDNNKDDGTLFGNQFFLINVKCIYNNKGKEYTGDFKTCYTLWYDIEDKTAEYDKDMISFIPIQGKFKIKLGD